MLMSDDESLDISLERVLPFLKRWGPLFVLLAILLWGYSLRAYHINYPVIGYHNTKEAHTLGEAFTFYKGESVVAGHQNYYALSDPAQGLHADNFPILGWIIVLFWNIFGLELWPARLVVILFSLGTIALTYIVAKQLFKKEDVSLFAALVTAACPLLVFFGRNVQYDVPATLFLMAGIAAYLQWRKIPETKWFFLMSLSIAFAAVSKWPTLIMVVPILITFPYSRLWPLEELKKNYKQYLTAIPPFILMVWWWFFSKTFNPNTAVSLTRDSTAHMSQFFTSRWWQIVYQYAITDNFSLWGLRWALAGVVLSIVFIKKFRYRFIAIWSLSFLLYGFMFANFLSHHNYYQVPFAPLWGILVALALTFLASVIPKVKMGSAIPGKAVRWVVLLAFFFFVLLPPFTESANRQFATQFYGLDVAGNYIVERANDNDLILDSAHQDRGLLWHSKHDLVVSANLTDIMKKEEEGSLRWAFAYQWGINKVGVGVPLLAIPEIADHIYSNYTLRQFAFFIVPGPGGQQQVQEMYYLYRYGGSSPTREEFLNNLSTIVQSYPIQKRVYDDPYGRQIELLYLTFD